MNASTANGSGSLRPTWSRSTAGSGGRGFQPPPPLPTERRARSGSQGSSGSGSHDMSRPVNKFAALDDDEEESTLSRTPVFRSVSSEGRKGRSLADLVSSVPEISLHRGNSSGYRKLDPTLEAKIVRFTREKLLALRPRPDPDQVGPPDNLRHLVDNPILSAVPLDPVCWESFDADEIWALAARERPGRNSSLSGSKSSTLKGSDDTLESSIPRRSSSTNNSAAGKWQRGVALPPPEESHRRGNNRSELDQSDLWDDPLADTGKALDFSAFGEIPDDPKTETFDFEKMTEASQAFEVVLRSDDTGEEEIETEDEKNSESVLHTVVVNPHRPLATAGTTIRSGSGDHVNVFEDFSDPPEPIGVRAAVEDPSASSRLMKMIGVNQEKDSELSLSDALVVEDINPILTNLNPWASSVEESVVQAESGVNINAKISSNPWGDSILIQRNQSQPEINSFDLAARLHQEQQARDELLRRQSQEAELRRRQEEEARRRVLEERARQQATQQNLGHSEVELVLMERISTILENSWGRAEVRTILSTLHAEDARVVPLLSTTDALRALLVRHPRRVAMRQDPTFGSEMVVLLMTNAQFQQQESQVRVQKEQIQRREQQMRLQQGLQNGSRSTQLPVIIDAPWYYSDPQHQIQGPFRGEEMRQWLEAGYFKGDLPISQQPGGPFHPLSALFQDLSIAFRFPGQTVEVEEAAIREANLARAKEELERREAERIEAERKEMERRDAERKAAEEERVKAEAAAARQAADLEASRRAAESQKDSSVSRSSINEQNKSSAQLKMLLGLGMNQHDNTIFPNSSSEQQSNASTSVPSSIAPPVPARGVWGGSSSTAIKKSMSEIQQEEARQASLNAMEKKTTVVRTTSGGWANVAASRGGVAGWQGGAAVASPVVSNPARPQSNGRSALAQQRQISAPSPSSASRSQEKSQSVDFGANISPALESWCKSQMMKINGSDDLTLVSFCMTLTDASEIKQYLTAYLGSSPLVSSFAAEFIQKRGLNKTQQEEWENTKTKKNRKKGSK